MIVLSPRCPGMVVECTCGAVLAYNAADVYDDSYVRCPVCGEKVEVKILNVETSGISSKEGQ